MKLGAGGPDVDFLRALIDHRLGRSERALGRLRTLVNGLETANDAKAYEVGFAYSGGRMHLKTFKEVTHAAP